VVISRYYNLEDKTLSINVPLQLLKATTLKPEIIDPSKMIISLDELITLNLGDIFVMDVQSFTKLEEFIAGVSRCLINSSRLRI